MINFKTGALYRCKKYNVLLYPSPENALTVGVCYYYNSGLYHRHPASYCEMLSKYHEAYITYIPAGQVFMSLEDVSAYWVPRSDPVRVISSSCCGWINVNNEYADNCIKKVSTK